MLLRLVRASALAVLISLAVVASAAASTFTVETTGDAGFDLNPGNGTCASAMTGPCTLRAAITEANGDTDQDTIVLPAGTYDLTATTPLGGENAGQNGDLDITNPLTINGAGARTTIVTQAVKDRVFQVGTGAGTVTFNGITVAGGDEPEGGPGGGGILNLATLNLNDSAVRGNDSAGFLGGGIYNSTTLTVQRSLIAGNTGGTEGDGGGIYNSDGFVNIANSTLSGNSAPDGAAVYNAATSPTFVLQYSTVANNTPGVQGAALTRATAGGSAQIHDSIVSNSQTNCSGTFSTLGHNVESGNSCNFTNVPAGDKQNIDPGLGPLAYSRPEDQTETHALGLGSPAIDNGNATGCPATDQRGVNRPIGPTCDTGAFEAQPVPPPAPRPSSLTLDPANADRTPGDPNTITATARNDNGSPAVNRTIRYQIAGANEGAGVVTTDASGVARISWEGVHEGTDTLSAFVDTNGDATSGADEPVAQARVQWSLPAPVQGRTFNLEPISGTVRIRLPRTGSGRTAAAGATNAVSGALTQAEQVPFGTVVDVRGGRVQLSSAANASGAIQRGQFYAGIFQTTQSRTGTRPVTELRLTESLICPRRSRSRVTASRARSRRLWGNGRGRFRTRGRHSTATVRGTTWLTKDACNTTTTVVREGTVTVRDLHKRKNVRVKAGRRYVARARTRRR